MHDLDISVLFEAIKDTKLKK